MVFAPHPDDETLGCGGTLLKYVKLGFEIHWVIVTAMTRSGGYNELQIKERDALIKTVSEAYQFNSVHKIGLATGSLSDGQEGKLIECITSLVQDVKPNWVFCPARHDAHSDHRITFDAVLASCKSFRAPFVKRILAYETVSETEFGLRPHENSFVPNVYESIAETLEDKKSILELYKGEIQDFPFPRSIEVVDSLAKLRGSQCNALAAEAFYLVKEIR